MEETDVYDDIDYDIENYQDPKEDCISTLCLAIYYETNSKTNFVGTGIIMSKDGIFISAAHNFKDKKKEYKILYQGQSYEFEILYEEYIKGKQDLAICIITKFDSYLLDGISLPKFGECKNLEIGSPVDVVGYKSIRCYACELLSEDRNTTGKSFYKHRVHKQIINACNGQDRVEQDFNNEIMFYLDLRQTKYFGGFSGGPVYKDNLLYGIVLSNYFLKIDYILDKIKQNTSLNE